MKVLKESNEVKIDYDELKDKLYDHFDEFVEKVTSVYETLLEQNRFLTFYFYYEPETDSINYTINKNRLKYNQSKYILFDVIEFDSIFDMCGEDGFDYNDYIYGICDMDINEFWETNGELMDYCLNN